MQTDPLVVSKAPVAISFRPASIVVRDSPITSLTRVTPLRPIFCALVAAQSGFCHSSKKAIAPHVAAAVNRHTPSSSDSHHRTVSVEVY
ncbi:MAG: hypothetical protein OXC17_01835 [Aestuariivita sp.]|nr:hypothetical protein [Aestuariivita sp.]